MLDDVSLDQRRTFVAAARILNRVHPAVSGWANSLKTHIGVVLFDRSGRYPELTPEGVILLADARNIVAGVDTLKARARLMAAGLEAELSLAVDVFFPTALISAAAKALAGRFPLTPLRVFVKGLGAGYQPVVDARCNLGILAPLPIVFPALVSKSIGRLSLVTVAARDHPLGSFKRCIPKAALAKHVQLVDGTLVSFDVEDMLPKGLLIDDGRSSSGV